MGCRYLQENLSEEKNVKIYPATGGNAAYRKYGMSGIPIECEADEKPVGYFQSHEGRKGHHDLNNFNGSDKDDFAVMGKIDDGRSSKASSSVWGGEGFDTVIVNGDRGSYTFLMPENVSDYPLAEADIWKDHDSLYGRMVVLENNNTGDSVILYDVENIAFDPEGKIGFNNSNPVKVADPIADGRLAKAIEDGTVLQVGIQDAIISAEENMGPFRVDDAKYAATKQASSLMDKTHGDPALYMEDDELAKANRGIVMQIKASGISPEPERSYTVGDTPVSPNSLIGIGITLPSM